MPDTAMRADARWRPQEQLSLPPLVRDWLADPGSLTARLRLYGAFRVVPREDRIIRPTLAEQQLLGRIGRGRALVREVTLLVDEEPVVEARSVLPLASLRGPNRGLAHMGSRSLGNLLLKYPKIRYHFCGHTHVPGRHHVGQLETINIGSTYLEKRYEVLEL